MYSSVISLLGVSRRFANKTFFEGLPLALYTLQRLESQYPRERIAEDLRFGSAVGQGKGPGGG